MVLKNWFLLFRKSSLYAALRLKYTNSFDYILLIFGLYFVFPNGGIRIPAGRDYAPKGGIMKKILVILAFTLLQVGIATAGDHSGSYGSGYGSSYGIGSSYGSRYGSSSVTVRDSGSMNTYRGYRDNSDGYTRVRDYEGNTLRGTIDNDGYGRLRDQDGNVHKVRGW